MILQHSFESSRKLFEYALCKSSSFSPELRSSKGLWVQSSSKITQKRRRGKRREQRRRTTGNTHKFYIPDTCAQALQLSSIVFKNPYKQQHEEPLYNGKMEINWCSANSILIHPRFLRLWWMIRDLGPDLPIESSKNKLEDYCESRRCYNHPILLLQPSMARFLWR